MTAASLAVWGLIVTALASGTYLAHALAGLDALVSIILFATALLGSVGVAMTVSMAMPGHSPAAPVDEAQDPEQDDGDPR